MGWTRCPQCEFTQIASENCLRCGARLPKPIPKTRRSTASTPVAEAVLPARRAGTVAAVAGVILLAAAVGVTLWLRRAPAPGRAAAAGPPAAPTPAALDLAGSWHAEKSKTLAGSHPRPVLKEARIETNRDGAILAARVVLTDPGNGGAGAGYRVAPDGGQRLADAVAALATSSGGAPVKVDFIPFPPWMPQRTRLWRALEGQSRKRQNVRYLLLESIEDDYVVQAGINETGFLSYVFFSPAYASGRGIDELSRVIHPEPGSDLREFHNLVWDLSGSTDFLNLQVNATLTGPDNQTDRLVLKR
jgi:hypothetical protein